MATVQVLYFAWLRERTGTGRETVALGENVATIGALMAQLRARGGGYETAFSLGRVVRAAVNQDFALPDAPVRDGDEVAFFPPVTGG